MQSMLSICDRFESDFSVIFNGNKLKYIALKACDHCAARDNITPIPYSLIGGHAIENVLSWPHLGHIFSAYLSDDDILAC
jgi:hypothetical protein